MQFKNLSSTKFLGLVLILCLTKVCQGQLMCYVCDDCDKVSLQTPQFECNENFFSTSGATSSSVQTTTEHSTTTVGVTTEMDTTSTEGTTLTPVTEETTTTTTASSSSSSSSTTESKSPETTTKATSTTNATATTIETTTLKEIETTSTTEDQPPSPPTVGPPSSTTGIPTPPTPDTLQPLDDVDNLNNRTGAHDQHVNKDEVENVNVDNGTAKPYKPSAEFRVRQLRSVSDMSFHCFKVKATTANGTMVVNRGCSRVATNESVCGQWESQHPNEKMNKCYPCSKTKCNSSSALSVSLAALFMTAVAVFLQRK